MKALTIRKYLCSHPRLDLIQYIVRKKLPSVKACQEMLDMEKNPLVVKYRHYGELNKERTIYHIYLGNGERKISGYCSLLRDTLLLLAYADRMGFIPVVEWDKTTLYTEEELINGTANGYEYFFLNASELKVDDIYKSALVVRAKVYDIRLICDFSMKAGRAYEFGEREIKILSEMYAKYIKFNETGIKEIVNPVYEMLGKGSCLGVHVRGTDFNKGYEGHPKAISVEKIISKVEKILFSHQYQYIFLATDEVQTVKIFRDKFGDKLLYFDALRSEDGSAVHYGMNSAREHNKYYLGMEILRDVYALGHCDALVAGLSNVRSMAEAIKKSTGMPYQDKVILNEGINENLHTFTHL